MAISLVKGQKISLVKEGDASLTKVVMGLGWDAKKVKTWFGGQREQAIDLDASCILFDQSQRMVDAIWFRQLRSKDGSIIHTGDNRTGAGEGDDEQIIVDLMQIPSIVTSMVFVVNSFSGEDFSQIENAFCRLVDQRTTQEIARYDLSCQGQHTAQIMAKVYRHGGEWKMHAVGENASGRTFQDLLPVIVKYL